MTRCSAKTVSGRSCKCHVYKDSLCWVHQDKQELGKEQLGKEEIICGICLEENSENSLVLKCGHIFCKSCIYTWIIHKFYESSCPMCREPIDSLTFFDARTWGVEIGELFYINTVCYSLSIIDEIDQYYLTAFYNIIPGSRITNSVFEKIYQNMIGDTRALDIIKNLTKTTEVRRSLYKKSHQEFSKAKQLYFFMY